MLFHEIGSDKQRRVPSLRFPSAAVLKGADRGGIPLMTGGMTKALSSASEQYSITTIKKFNSSFLRQGEWSITPMRPFIELEYQEKLND